MEDQIRSLKELRKKLGISTTQLAHRLGVGQPSVVRLEQAEQRGAISLSSLKRAAEALNARLEYSLVPQDKHLESKPRRSGLIRLPRYPARRRSINDVTQSQPLESLRSSSPNKRVLQACALSDLSRKIRLCSTKL